MITVRTNGEIEDQMNLAIECEDTGVNPYSGMTFAAGVRATIEWLQGDVNEPPIDEWRVNEAVRK